MSLRDYPYPAITPYMLPYDIDNGPHIGNIIKRNPEGVIAMFVCPCGVGVAGKFNDEDDSFFQSGGMVGYGAAKDFLGAGSQKLIDYYPKADTKYYALALQVCDPRFPHKNDLIVGEARYAEFQNLAEGQIMDYEGIGEVYGAISSLIKYAPESTLMVIDVGGLYREYELIQRRLAYWTSETLKFYTGIHTHEEKGVRFDY